MNPQEEEGWGGGGGQGKEELLYNGEWQGPVSGGKKEVKVMHPEHREDSLSRLIPAENQKNKQACKLLGFLVYFVNI